MDIDLMLEAVQAERDAVVRRLEESKRVRAVLASPRPKPLRGGHAASGVRHAIAHALSVGHARMAHEHACA